MSDYFQNFMDDEWFKTYYNSFGIDPSIMGPDIYKSNQTIADYNSIDLSNIDFISFFDLLNLFLLIDIISQNCKSVNVVFFDPSSHIQELMPIDRFLNLRKSKKYKQLDLSDRFIYDKALKAYSLIAFCNHFGLFSAFSRHRDIGKVVMEGIDNALLNKLVMYSGVMAVGSRILPLTPISRPRCPIFLNDT